jgi:hypothetical protein
VAVTSPVYGCPPGELPSPDPPSLAPVSLAVPLSTTGEALSLAPLSAAAPPVSAVPAASF